LINELLQRSHNNSPAGRFAGYVFGVFHCVIFKWYVKLSLLTAGFQEWNGQVGKVFCEVGILHREIQASASRQSL
jgi:hypothetical protein